MRGRRRVQQAAWIAYAIVAVTHMGALAADLVALAAWTKALAIPMLLVVVLAAPMGRPQAFGSHDVPAPGTHILLRSSATGPRTLCADRLRLLMALALVAASLGDSSALLAPGHQMPWLAGFFFVAMLLYIACLAPLWLRAVDLLRVLMIVPYAVILTGLCIICADRVGAWVPLMAAYAVALATVATLSAGVNALTWTGGTLFLLSSSQLAMVWFLPDAAFPGSELVVMLTYYVGHALLVEGLLATMPVLARRRVEAPSDPLLPGAHLIVSE